MLSEMTAFPYILLLILRLCTTVLSDSAFQPPTQRARCRNVPGSPGFPTNDDFSILNKTVSGRLVKVVPFVEHCTSIGGCTFQQFTSSVFRDGVPGAMNQVRKLDVYHPLLSFNSLCRC